ncbi:hypothetical protein VE00_10054 [Pseudogymnoascus sp. WSF 3629]|nr:hypothetical protein VE00_10054 [Pseudogymnoascus sp. WSF 3629]
MNNPQDPHPEDELSDPDPEAITHAAEPSNTDTATTLRGSSEDRPKADSFTALGFWATLSPPSNTPPNTPPNTPSNAPATIQVTGTLRVATIYTDTPPPSPPDSVAAPAEPRRILTVLTNTPPPSPPINPSDIVLPPIDVEAYDAAGRARAYSRMERGLARLRAKLYARVVRNAMVRRWNRQTRYAKVWVWTLVVSLLVGVALVIVAGVQFWKANKAR